MLTRCHILQWKWQKGPFFAQNRPLAGWQTTQWDLESKDSYKLFEWCIITLFSLPLCVVCHPARCFFVACSLRASSPIWTSEMSLTRMLELAARPQGAEKGASASLWCVLARLTSLAQIGELACRLCAMWLFCAKGPLPDDGLLWLGCTAAMSSMFLSPLWIFLMQYQKWSNQCHPKAFLLLQRCTTECSSDVSWWLPD